MSLARQVTDAEIKVNDLGYSHGFPADRCGGDGMRRTRMKMRCLLIAVAITAVAAWWFIDQPKRRGKAIATTQRVGGFVQLDGEYQPELQPTPALPVARQDRARTGRSFSLKRLTSPALPIGLARWSDRFLGPEFAHALSVVGLDGQRIEDNDLASFETIVGLRRLYLKGTPITDAGLAHLADLPELEILELRETKIGDAGLYYLKRLTRLRALYLYGTRVGDSGMASLARLRNLDELSLAHTAVGDAGLAHLAGLTRLKFLKLGKTRITDAGLLHLAGLKNLEFLDLAQTDVTDEGLAHLSGLTELRLLFVDGTKVTAAGQVALQRALPSVQIFSD
jgi:hypothetical protein